MPRDDGMQGVGSASNDHFVNRVCQACNACGEGIRRRACADMAMRRCGVMGYGQPRGMSRPNGRKDEVVLDLSL